LLHFQADCKAIQLCFFFLCNLIYQIVIDGALQRIELNPKNCDCIKFGWCDQTWTQKLHWGWQCFSGIWCSSQSQWRSFAKRGNVERGNHHCCTMWQLSVHHLVIWVSIACLQWVSKSFLSFSYCNGFRVRPGFQRSLEHVTAPLDILLETGSNIVLETLCNPAVIKKRQNKTVRELKPTSNQANFRDCREMLLWADPISAKIFSLWFGSWHFNNNTYVGVFFTRFHPSTVLISDF
jgi:hypothetical protein